MDHERGVVLTEVPPGRAADFAKAMRTRRFWGEPIEFATIEAVVAAWWAARPESSYVVVASADPFVLLLEGSGEAVEPEVNERLDALRAAQRSRSR
jgi:hypothetical protein